MSHETWQYAGRLECCLDFWYNLLRLFVNLILEVNLSRKFHFKFFNSAQCFKTPCISSHIEDTKKADHILEIPGPWPFCDDYFTFKTRFTNKCRKLFQRLETKFKSSSYWHVISWDILFIISLLECFYPYLNSPINLSRHLSLFRLVRYLWRRSGSKPNPTLVNPSRNNTITFTPIISILKYIYR